MDDSNRGIPESNDRPLIELPPLTPAEHPIGIQVSIGGIVKDKMDDRAVTLLRERGESFLQEIVLEAKGIVTFDQPKLLDPKVRPEDIARALDRVVSRYTQRSGRISKLSRFLHEVPVLLFAVGLTKFSEGLIQWTKIEADASVAKSVAVDAVIGCAATIISLILFFSLGQHE